MGWSIICFWRYEHLLRDTSISTKYRETLESFNLHQLVSKPTRHGKTLIDHILTNVPEKCKYTDVLPCDHISDHDAPYVLFNARADRFEPRFKIIRNEKCLNMNNFISDFKQIPMSLVYTFDSPDDQLNTLNTLIADCINKHAPLKYKCNMI